jgi:L-ascorbate metabolism protein UlaG (beta-lactamase superfamily)
MNRRLFLNRVLKGLKLGLLLSAVPIMPSLKETMASNAEHEKDLPVENMTLRAIAAEKLHHGHDRFVNPFTRIVHGRLSRVLYWKLFTANRFTSYYKEERVHPVSIDWKPVRDSSGLSVTFLKHASILIKDIDQYIVVDPVFSRFFWGIQDFTPFAFDIEDMPRPQHVLITHGHYDHLDKRTLAGFGRDTHVISPLGYDAVFKELGMSRRTQLDWFEGFEQEGRQILLLPCNHWSMRNLLVGPNRSLWGSFLIKTVSGFTIFVAGDTGWFSGFRELGQEFKIDLAIFNLSAYEPRWFMAPSHMNPEETVRAFQELGATHLLIVHWGTFRLGDEPVHFPPIDMQRAIEKKGLSGRWIPLRHGETLYCDELSG